MMTPFKRKRLAAGLTQKELAEKLGLDPATASNWERGESFPEPKYFPRLAEIFGISAEDVTHLFDPQPASA